MYKKPSLNIKKTRWFWLAQGLILGLVACSDGTSTSNAESQRGTLLKQAVETVPVTGATVSGDAVIAGFNQLALTVPLFATLKTSLPGLNGTQAAGSPNAFPCSFSVSKINYLTVGAQGESTTATAAVMLPKGNAAPCNASTLPVVMAAHGTRLDKSYDVSANANFVSSGSSISESLVWALLYAAQGYVVVAPNYAGYDTSDLGYHPYLLMTQQAKDMIDAYTAAKATGLFTPNGKLFVSGYSQGGAVAVATQRALQTAGTPATAVAGLSGPYAMLDFGDAILSGKVNRSANYFAPLLIQSYQKAYGNIYGQASDLFATNFTGAAGFFPTGSLALTDANGQPTFFGSLSASPLLPSLATDTYTFGLGANSIINSKSRNAYLSDMTSSSVNYPLRKALQQNDLRSGWNPASPLLLCGASNDGTVFYNENTLGFADYISKTRLNANTTPALAVLDLNSAIKPTDDGFNAFRSAFATAWSSVTFESSRTSTTTSTDVHGNGAPPYCYAASLSFFTQVKSGAIH